MSHDHVVTTFAVEPGALPYLAMEYIDGISLQQKLDREGPLELREILRIGMQTAYGLAAAHGQGLIHRDIKPSNILLQNKVERVQITDFGLARAVDDVSITRTGEITGTPQYMSPEQAQGLPADQRTDLFSLGSVLYAMCTGRSPFRAESTMAVLHRVCNDAPRAIREVNPDIPDWLVAIIDRLLEKNPGDRFQTAAEVADVLSQYLAHVQQPTVVPLPTPILGTSRIRTRFTGRPKWYIGAILLALMLGSLALTEAAGVTNLAATVIRIATGEGTLVIEVDDPTVEVSLDGEELTITGAGIQELKLRPGQYQFRATKDGEPVKQELVTISRGGRRMVSVRLESPTITPISQANIFSKRKQWETAIDNYSEIIKLRPDDYEAWRERGETCWLLGCLDQAIEDCSQAIRLKPDDIESYLWRSAAYRNKGDYAEAIDDCNSALRIDPKSTWALHNRAIAYRVWGRFNEAVKDANVALEIEPYHAGLFGERALSYIQLKQLDKALADCNEAIRFEPEKASFYMTRAEVYLGLDRYNEALADCSKYAELTSDDAIAALIRAQILLIADRTEEYRQACVEMLDRFGRSENPGIFCHAARACVLAPEAIPDPMAPVKLAAEAVLRNPVHWHLHTLGMAHFGAGQLDEAAQRFRESLNTDPNWQARYLNWLGLALVCHKRGDTEEARVWLRKAIDLMQQGPIWNREDRYEGQILRREAERLLGESKQALPATAEKDAFVVLAGDGAEVAKFDTLAEAVLGSSAGDTIEIRGDGPFITDPIVITHQLTIQAAAGFRPMIQGNPKIALSYEQPLLLSADSSPLVEGLDLECLPEQAGGQLLRVGGQAISTAQLYAANCRIAQGGVGGGVFCSGNGHLRNCVVVAPQGVGFGWKVPHKGRFAIENCILVGWDYSFLIEAENDAVIRLVGNSLLNPSPVFGILFPCLAFDPENRSRAPLRSALRIAGSSNVFDSPTAALQFRQHPRFVPRFLDVAEAEALVPRLVEWRVVGNLYRSPMGLLILEELETTRGQDLEDWNRFWGLADTESSRGVIRYQGGDLYTKALSSPDKLTPEDFRLRPDSAGYRAGPDGKDLGADIDLVGPGEAYERWKGTPEYQEWQKETRELMKAAAADQPQAEGGAETETAEESQAANSEDDQPRDEQE